MKKSILLRLVVSVNETPERNPYIDLKFPINWIQFTKSTDNIGTQKRSRLKIHWGN